ncbi:hypothetical protein ABIB62_003006 [Mucilaginibacter sp. UYP25]
MYSISLHALSVTSTYQHIKKLFFVLRAAKEVDIIPRCNVELRQKDYHSITATPLSHFKITIFSKQVSTHFISIGGASKLF